MGTIGTLQHDHRLLRRKLVLLESALQVSPETRFVIREMCFSLLRLLQEHMHREDAAVASCTREGLGGPQLLQGWDHLTEHAHLRAVNELLLGGMKASMSSVVIRLSQAIEELGQHMAAQERLVFPFLQDEPEGLGETTGPRAAISGTMSVNEILQRYPQTERIFEELEINRWRDGYESVDELAWRHGIDVEQIVAQLQHAVTSFPHN